MCRVVKVVTQVKEVRFFDIFTAKVPGNLILKREIWLTVKFQRIMEFAENLALDHKYDKELGHRLKMEPSRQG